MTRLGHLFPYLPKQPGYNKRMRALAPQIVRLLTTIARLSPSWCDNIRLLDSTPVPCGASRETVRRSEFAGYAAYGYCASHSRFFWGFRLYLLCAPDGMPIAFELAPANVPERDVAAEMLRNVDLHGYTVIADKGFAGEDFETLMRELGAIFLRPDRKNEPARFGKLGGVRQWIESIIDTLKGQLFLEDHGAHHARPHHPYRPTPARPRRSDLAQLAALASQRHRHPRPQPHRLRPLDPPDGISHLGAWCPRLPRRRGARLHRRRRRWTSSGRSRVAPVAHGAGADGVHQAGDPADAAGGAGPHWIDRWDDPIQAQFERRPTTWAPQRGAWSVPPVSNASSTSSRPG